MNGCSPVRLAGGSNLADSVSVPAEHWREGPDEGEGPHKQQTDHRVLGLQPHVPQRSTDHKEPLEGEHGEGPHRHDPWERETVGIRNATAEKTALLKLIYLQTTAP